MRVVARRQGLMVAASPGDNKSVFSQRSPVQLAATATKTACRSEAEHVLDQWIPRGWQWSRPRSRQQQLVVLANGRACLRKVWLTLVC